MKITPWFKYEVAKTSTSSQGRRSLSSSLGLKNMCLLHVLQMLRDRFKEFARDTESIGQERVAAVNEVCDRLISSGHSDAAVIAEWKDTINELWADLLEMIDTRTQMLAASYELFKFYNDCKELLERIRVSSFLSHSLMVCFYTFPSLYTSSGCSSLVVTCLTIVCKVGSNPW